MAAPGRQRPAKAVFGRKPPPHAGWRATAHPGMVPRGCVAGECDMHGLLRPAAAVNGAHTARLGGGAGRQQVGAAPSEGRAGAVVCGGAPGVGGYDGARPTKLCLCGAGQILQEWRPLVKALRVGEIA